MTAGHGHDHPHPHPDPAVENPHAGQGTVVVDIGGGFGAMVIDAPAAMTGVEIELAPVDGSAAPTHVAVVPRPTPSGRRLPTAVFPALPVGTYEVWERPGGPVALTVEIRDGEVALARWPG